MSNSSDISIKRNNDRNLNIAVKKDGVAVDITGWTVKMAVKRSRDDTDAEAIFVKTVTSHTDPTAGETTIPIAASDTADEPVAPYYYDILVIDDQSKRQSSNTGNFIIVQEVTDGA